MNIKFPKLSLGNISPIRKDEKLNTSRNFPVESVLASKYFLESAKQNTSLDMSVVLPSKAKEQKLHLKEFLRLENELDIKEIEATKEKNIDKEIHTYKSYLEGISFCLRFRDKELAKGILRGLRGFLRIISELLNKPTIIADKKKAKTKEISIQTDEEPIPDDIENYNQEIQFLKGLEAKLYTIKSSKVANRLFEAYDSLIKMHTALPSPVHTPEVLDIDEVTEKLQDKIVRIKEELIAHVSKMHNKSAKFDAETQTELIKNNRRHNSKNEENEEDLFYELQKKYEKIYNEKRKLEEVLKGRKNVSDNIEDHLTHVELELFHYKKQASGYEDTIKNLKTRSMVMKEKIDNLEMNINLLRDEVKAANAKTESKKNKIQELTEEVYKITLNWKLNEKRLKQLSDAWRKKTGKMYEHEEINENELLKDIELPKKKDKKEKVEEEKIIKNTEIASDRKTNKTNTNKGAVIKKQNSRVENPKHSVDSEVCSQIETLLPLKQKITNKKPVKKLPSPEIISPIPSKKPKSKIKSPKSQSPKLFHDSQIQTSIARLNNSNFEIRVESPEDKKWKILKQKQEEKLLKVFKDENQRELFEEYKAILEKKIYKKPSKSPKVYHKSSEDSYTDLNSDTNLSQIYNSDNLSQKTIEKYEESYEKMKNDPEFMSAIGKVFDSEEDIDILPLQVRVNIMKALKGHERKKCGNKCDHLRRAMMIKYKEKGIPYPIKQVSVAG